MTHLDLYHRTSPEAAAAILRDQRMHSKENDGSLYFSTKRDGGQAEGYGHAVVHVRVPEHLAELDDEFPDGEQHYRVNARHLQPKHFVRTAAKAGLPEDAEFHFTKGSGGHLGPDWAQHRLDMHSGGRSVGDLHWDGVGDISGVNVDPRHQHRGIATALYTHAHELAQKHGIEPPGKTVFQTPSGRGFRQNFDQLAERPDVSHIPSHTHLQRGSQLGDIRQHMVTDHGMSGGVPKTMDDAAVHRWHDTIGRQEPCPWADHHTARKAPAARPQGGSGAASVGDVGAQVGQASARAQQSLGALQQAHSDLEEAQGLFVRAAEGSSQADAPETNELLGRALGSITEVQQAVQAAIQAAGSVRGRPGGSSTKWVPPLPSQRVAANKVQTCPECEGTGEHPWAVRNPAGWAGTPCPRCDGAKTTKVPDWTPPKTSPAQQTAFDHPDWDTSRSQLLDVAKDRTPGTTIWRSEVRHKDHLDNPPSIGMHWTTNPDQVVIQGHDMEPDHHQVVWQGRLHDRDQAFPRSHPMWSGKHMSMDREAEVRLKPGSTVHVDRRYVHDNSTSSAAFAPRHPARSSGAWEAHDMDHHVPVAHGKGGYSDYSDVGIHHTAATMADAGLRWVPRES